MAMMSDSTLVPSTQWHQLRLVRQLHDGYGAALTRVYQAVLPIARARPLGSEEFTDHDIAHSTRLAERMGKIVPADVHLNQPELYIVLLAALLHDIGMWMPRQEALALLDNDDRGFLDFCARYHAAELETVRDALASASHRWLGEMGLQRLAAAYARQRHPARAAALLTSSTPQPHEAELRTLIDPAFLDAVAVVSEAHGWERQRVLDDRDLHPREVGGELVNLRYLAALLRLGDLLDLGEGRVSSLLWKFLLPMQPVSEAHWRKEKTLRLDRCEPDLIEVAGTFDVERDGIVAADAYALANDWLEWLQEEINGCAVLLERRMEPDLARRYRFGRLELRRDRVTAVGLLLGGAITFQLDRDRLIDLLGREIYADGCIFARELIQNAVDATRAQMVRDYANSAKYPGLPRAAPWEWPEAITSQDGYRIEVVTGTESIDGRTYDTFLVRDRGIGMTPQQLSDYFLQIGRSYYTTTQFLREFTHPSISRFGIGFLSCLVAERLEVVTRARGEAAGLRLNLTRPSAQFTVTKDPDADFGTTVRLWLAPEKVKEHGWDRFPAVKDRAQTFDLPEAAGGTAFAVAAKKWMLWAEAPILVDGVAWTPRAVRTGPRTLASNFARSVSGLERRWFPLTVTSSTGQVLAEANLGVLALGEPSRLPIVPEYVPNLEHYITTLIAARGIWVGSQRGYSGMDLQLNLNFLKLPPQALTASRILAGGLVSSLAEQIARAAILKLIHWIYGELSAMAPEAAALWRLPMETNDKQELPERLIPYRTATASGWMPEQKLSDAFPRVIVSPMMVALAGPWNLDVPCVGYLYPRAHAAFQDLAACQLVTVDDRFTGVLYPADASTEGLTPFTGARTHTPHGMYAWKGRAAPRRMQDGHEIEQYRVRSGGGDFVFRGRLPKYDQHGNPWLRLRFSPEELWDPSRDSEFAAGLRARVASVPPLDFPEGVIDLVLQDPCADWT